MIQHLVLYVLAFMQVWEDQHDVHYHYQLVYVLSLHFLVHTLYAFAVSDTTFFVFFV